MSSVSYKNPQKNIFSGILSLVFFISHCAFAHAVETSFWTERRREVQNRQKDSTLLASLPSAPSSDMASLIQQFPGVDPRPRVPSVTDALTKDLPHGFVEQQAPLLNALSTAYGSIRKISLPDHAGVSPKIVVHIQDVHQNQEAQNNIGQVLQSLVGKDQIGLVALEGMFKTADLSGFRKFSRQDVLKKWADFLLKTNRISGPIHAALTAPKAFPPILGIDDPSHYDANVAAYRLSAPHIQEIKEKIALQKANLDQQKTAVYTPHLLSFDKQVQAFDAGQIGLGQHIKNLAAQIPSDLRSPTVQKFLKTLDLEAALDFKRVEKERVQLVEKLVQKLDKPQLQRLMGWSAAYRAGEVRYADFYQSLRDLCRENGVPLTRFPALDQYIQYVLSADGIDPETLLAEMAALQKRAFASLIQTPQEKELAEKSNRLKLTTKLLDFSLSPNEYQEYARLEPKMEGLSDFENFYKEAHFRDQAMANNLFAAMEKNNTHVAVMVTGGYHNPGLLKRFHQAGVVVITFSPKIERIDSASGSTYLSVFTQEKTPLEKMFQGQKLFLAQSPVAGLNTASAELTAGALVTDLQTTAFSRTEIQGEADQLLAELKSLGGVPQEIQAPRVQVKKKGEGYEVTVDVQMEMSTRKVRYNVDFDKEGNYFNVASAEFMDSFDTVLQHAREMAPATAAEMMERTKALFAAHFGEAFAEIPILSGLTGMTLGEILWVLNTHDNTTPRDVLSRIVKLEMLRHLSLLAETGRWIAPPTLVQNLLGPTPDIPELTAADKNPAETTKALAHFLLNRNPEGVQRHGALNLMRFFTGIFGNKNQPPPSTDTPPGEDLSFYAIADQSRSPIFDSALENRTAVPALTVDLKKLPVGTIVHFQIADGHWDYTLRVEESAQISVWLRGDFGRITLPIEKMGTIDLSNLSVGNKTNGTLSSQGKYALVPYFTQTPFGQGERHLEKVEETLVISPQNIRVYPPQNAVLPVGAIETPKEKSPEEISQAKRAAKIDDIYYKLMPIQINLMISGGESLSKDLDNARAELQKLGFLQEDIDTLLNITSQQGKDLHTLKTAGTPSLAKSQQYESELKTKISEVLENQAGIEHTGDSSPATWRSTYLKGYLVLLGILGSLMGLAPWGDMSMVSLLAHGDVAVLTALLLWPVAYLLTPISSLSHFFETKTINTDLEKWILNHTGVVKGSSQYEALRQAGESFRTARRTGGFLAELVAHNRYNWKLLRHQLRSMVEVFVKEESIADFTLTDPNSVAPSPGTTQPLESVNQLNLNILPAGTIVRMSNQETDNFYTMKIEQRGIVSLWEGNQPGQFTGPTRGIRSSHMGSSKLAGILRVGQNVTLPTVNRGQAMETPPSTAKGAVKEIRVSIPKLSSNGGENTAAAEQNKTLVDTLLKLMPDVAPGTYSVGDLLGQAILNPSVALGPLAKAVVDNVPDRGTLKKNEAALEWVSGQLGIQTKATALVPLPENLLTNPHLDKIVQNTLTLHKEGGALFYVEAGADSKKLEKILTSFGTQAKLIRLPRGQKLFIEKVLSMATLERNTPRDLASVQPYLPEGFMANFDDVHDTARFSQDALRPMGLLVQLDRMIELARYIATQA